MKKTREILEKLGYSPEEAKLYLAALALGEATVSELAQHAEIPRTTASGIIARMKDKRLLTPFTKRRRTYWVAEDPAKLHAALRNDEQTFESILPKLVSLKRGEAGKTFIKYFTGLTEMKIIVSDIANSNHHMSALCAVEDWLSFFGEDYTRDFIEKQCAHFLRMRMICSKNGTSVRLQKNDSADLRQIKFLPKNVKITHMTNFIYGNKVAFFSFDSKNPMGVILEDPNIASAQMLYFESLWDLCSS